MKNLNFVTGFLAASCLFLLISANTKTTPTEDVPRYHLTWTNAGPVYAYDAITGKFKEIRYGRISKYSTIKEMVERPESD